MAERGGWARVHARLLGPFALPLANDEQPRLNRHRRATIFIFGTGRTYVLIYRKRSFVWLTTSGLFWSHEMGAP